MRRAEKQLKQVRTQFTKCCDMDLIRNQVWQQVNVTIMKQVGTEIYHHVWQTVWVQVRKHICIHQTLPFTSED